LGHLDLRRRRSCQFVYRATGSIINQLGLSSGCLGKTYVHE
jgi:hypothetical protein